MMLPLLGISWIISLFWQKWHLNQWAFPLVFNFCEKKMSAFVDVVFFRIDASEKQVAIPYIRYFLSKVMIFLNSLFLEGFMIWGKKSRNSNNESFFTGWICDLENFNYKSFLNGRIWIHDSHPYPLYLSFFSTRCYSRVGM